MLAHRQARRTARGQHRPRWRAAVAAVAAVGSAALLASVAAGALAVEADVLAQDATESPSDALDLTISNARSDDHPTVRVTVDVPSVIAAEVDASAFTLTENGEVRDVEVERLRSEDLEVILVLDSSGSMAGVPIAAAQEAALSFVASMPPAVPLSVIRFSTDVEQLTDFSTDRAQITAAVDELSAGGWTSMYDAVQTALDVYEEREATREAIVLLSDGGDNRSQSTLEDTVDRLAGGDEVLTIVELITAERPVPRERFGRDDPQADEIDLAALSTMTEAAGQGSVLSPDDLDALTEVYEDIAATLLNQYELTYDSQSFDAADLEVRFEQGEVVAVGGRTIDLPPPPAEEPATDEPAPEPPEPDEPEESEAAAPSPPLEPPATGWWTEPWAFRASIIVFLVGVVGWLLYSHAWRLTDHYGDR